MKKAILICYHGSKNPKGKLDTKKLSRILQKKNKKKIVKYGYLQNDVPSIKTQIDLLLKKKINKITIIPGMIFSGNHVTKDIPVIANKFKKNNKYLKISILPPLYKIKKFSHIIEKNINSKIKKVKKNKETCLIIVASNTLNREAIKQMRKITKNIASKYLFKNFTNLMIGFKSSLLKNKLLALNEKGFTKFVLIPVFLFRGDLLQNCINITNYFKKSKKNISCILMPHIKNYKEIANSLDKSYTY